MGKSNLIMKKRPLAEPTVADTVAAAVAAAVAGNIDHQDPDEEAVAAAAMAASEARDIYEEQQDEDDDAGAVNHHVDVADDMAFTDMQDADYAVARGQDSTNSPNDVHPQDLSHYVHVDVNADDMAADPTATAAAEQVSMHYDDDGHHGHVQQDVIHVHDGEEHGRHVDEARHHAIETQHNQCHYQESIENEHQDHLDHQIHINNMDHLTADHHAHAQLAEAAAAVDAVAAAAALNLVDSVPPPLIKRKDKSLGVLCVNFMHRYDQMKVENPHEIPEVSIDEAASKLTVEKRRIYDIINILEAIEVVSRKCKNTYNWHGMDGLEEVFRRLQKEAVILFPEDAAMYGFVEDKESDMNMDSGDVMEHAVADTVAAMSEGDFMHDETHDHADVTLSEDAHHVNEHQDHLDDHQEQPPSKRQRIASEYKKLDATVRTTTMKENSLGRLSQKFIQYFLVGHEFVELSLATDKILGKSDVPLGEDATNADIEKAKKQAAKMLKTKSRRLYDIANVMVSIGLIQKVNHTGGLTTAIGTKNTRSSFQWIYPLSAKDLWEGKKFDDAQDHHDSMHHVMSGGDHELHLVHHVETEHLVDESGHEPQGLEVPAPMQMHSEPPQEVRYESV